MGGWVGGWFTLRSSPPKHDPPRAARCPRLPSRHRWPWRPLHTLRKSGRRGLFLLQGGIRPSFLFLFFVLGWVGGWGGGRMDVGWVGWVGGWKDWVGRWVSKHTHGTYQNHSKSSDRPYNYRTRRCPGGGHSGRTHGGRAGRGRTRLISWPGADGQSLRPRSFGCPRP